jgi:hypothetical protein
VLMAAGTFRGCFKRHTRLRKLSSDGENASQVCGDFFQTAQKACMPAETSFGGKILQSAEPSRNAAVIETNHAGGEPGAVCGEHEPRIRHFACQG